MRKIYEKRFASQREALAYIEGACWKHVGRKGLLTRYDEYCGSSIYQISGDFSGRSHEDPFVLRLESDGYISIRIKRFNGRMSTGLGELMSTGLPEYVWPSLADYEENERLVYAVNEKLRELDAGISVNFSHRPNNYPVCLNTSVEPFEILTSPVQALKSKHARNCLSDADTLRFSIEWHTSATR